MHEEVWSRYDALNVGEGVGVRAGEALDYVGTDRRELQMLYHFDHAVPRDEARFLDPAPEFTLGQLKEIIRRWDEALGDEAVGGNGWQSVYVGNHDNPRVLSRFGDPVRYPRESATLLATVLLTLRGTPSLYQGDELGMTNTSFASLDEFDDVQVRNAYDALVRTGRGTDEAFLAAANRIARDHARTPFPWDASPNAGFTTGTPLKLNPAFPTVNAAAAEADPDSILHFYRRFLAFRQQTPTLVYGRYHDLRPDDPALWVYTRATEAETLLIATNWTGEVQDFEVPVGTLVFGNYAEEAPNLRPFEARVYRLGYHSSTVIASAAKQSTAEAGSTR
jgi:oligo-1,6-glucosidase